MERGPYKRYLIEDIPIPESTERSRKLKLDQNRNIEVSK